MHFEDDKPIQCDECLALIYPGQTAITWRSHRYCSEDCVKDAMFSEYAAEVDEEPVLTASDKSNIYADMCRRDFNGLQ